MQSAEKDHFFGSTAWRLLFTLLFTTLVAQPAKADDKPLAVPSGTILPVRLNSTISSAKCKPGQVITGRIMQDVPLGSSARIREGSKVIGRIVEVTSATASAQSHISFQFNKLISANRTIPITTNLRAITSFVGVREAQTPTVAPGEGDNFYDLPTTQVGGDAVYGYGGPVTTCASPKGRTPVKSMTWRKA